MPNFIKNLGLEALTETDDDAMRFMAVVAQEGKPIEGYYGLPYFNMHFGDAQFVLRTEKNTEEEGLRVTGMDTHSSGNCIWKARLSGMPLNPRNAEKTQHKCGLTRAKDGSGFAVVHIVNADVLPSFLEDDEVTLQMVAFPVLINYYADEDEYTDSQPEEENGDKWLVADGSIMPTGLLINRTPENREADDHPEMDDYTLIRGTVKAAYWGVTEFGDDKQNTYIRSIIETQFGDLELIHTREQVAEGQRKNIKIGCTVSGVFILSGDAAIYAYEEGIVRDEEHDLRALRYAFVKGEAERLGSILADDALYISDAAKNTYGGKNAIIEHMSYVSERTGPKYLAQMAVITSVDEGDGASAPPAYAIGKRCVVLSEEREDNYVSIAFIEVDAEGYITKMTVSTDRRYRFKCDPKPEHGNPSA